MHFEKLLSVSPSKDADENDFNDLFSKMDKDELLEDKDINVESDFNSLLIENEIGDEISSSKEDLADDSFECLVQESLDLVDNDMTNDSSEPSGKMNSNVDINDLETNGMEESTTPESADQEKNNPMKEPTEDIPPKCDNDEKNTMAHPPFQEKEYRWIFTMWQ